MSSVEKVNLYRHIANSDQINGELRKWIFRIAKFCDTYNKITNANINLYFYRPADPVKMCGYVELTPQVLQDLISSEHFTGPSGKYVSQRAILTTIYRFAMNFARMLWRILELPSFKTLSDVTATYDMLDLDELEKHVTFVMYKHGLNIDSAKDPLVQLRDYFSPFQDIYNMSTYPSIATSITQPVGTDTVTSFMAYNYSTGRLRLCQDPKWKELNRVNIRDINAINQSLCHFEQQIVNPYIIKSVNRANNTIEEFLPWDTGKVLYQVNKESDFGKLATRMKKYVRCGPSCSTQMMLDCAALFGVDVYAALLLICPWMEAAKDHSLFEILLAADPYLYLHTYIPAKEDKLGDSQEVAFLTNMFNENFQAKALVAQKGGKSKKTKQKGGEPSDIDKDMTQNTNTSKNASTCEIKTSLNSLILDEGLILPTFNLSPTPSKSTDFFYQEKPFPTIVNSQSVPNLSSVCNGSIDFKCGVSQGGSRKSNPPTKTRLLRH